MKRTDGSVSMGQGGILGTGCSIRIIVVSSLLGCELRVVEVEGREVPTNVELGFPVAGECEMNLVGARVGDVAREGSRLRFAISPWKIRTFELHPSGVP